MMERLRCAPQKISFPQDIIILNEAREDLEAIKEQIQYISEIGNISMNS